MALGPHILGRQPALRGALEAGGSLGDPRSKAAAVRAAALVAAVVILAATAPGQVADQRGDGPAAALVVTDEDTAARLAQARKLIAGRHYDEAIDILQDMLDRSDAGFVPTEQAGRFVSAAARAAEILAGMPPEGLEAYRGLYDSQAERLFKRAKASLDSAGLREIIHRFGHTRSGERAMNLLGGLLFDRGEFSQAARCWRDILERCPDAPLDGPALLAKVAVAHHFAGESAKAREAADRLERDHGDAEAHLAGRRQNAAAFVRKVLAGAPPRRPDSTPARADWPCLAGAPDSVAVMPSCHPATDPRWTWPSGSPDAGANVEAILTNVHGPYVYERQGRPKVAIAGGRAEVEFKGSGYAAPRNAKFVLPPVLHPIVVGQAVICRNADGVTAWDLSAGETIWSSVAFGMYRQPRMSPQIIYRGYYGIPGGQDEGNWTLTAGEDRIFAVGRFLPASAREASLTYRQYSARQADDTSALAAFSISRQGRMLWLVGNGEGDAEVVRSSRFMTAPTYLEGRLYVLAENLQACHLLCLSAETGVLIWNRVVGRTPDPSSGTTSQSNYRPPTQGSPPAVADGRVFVVTNAGVVAAFEADSGRAIWACQYDVRPDSLPAQGPRGQMIAPVIYSPNPIIPARGRVVCLPADSAKVLGLIADSGEVAWALDRQDQNDLTALDDGRLLVSGPGMMFLDAATGKVEWRAPRKIQDVHGRPAVTADAVLASGSGRLIRVSLADRSIAESPMPPDAILGNLISVRGRLLAANAAGVSAYESKGE